MYKYMYMYMYMYVYSCLSAYWSFSPTVQGCYRERERQADRRTDGQTDRQRARESERERERGRLREFKSRPPSTWARTAGGFETV